MSDSVVTHTPSPLVAGDIEPALAIDVSGSMADSASATTQIRKIDVVEEALTVIVDALAVRDSQAKRESHEEEGKGGLLTYTFASNVEELGDLRPDNLREIWNEKVQVGGGTRIVGAYEAILDAYNEEFASTPISERPNLFALFISDGEPQDEKEFEKILRGVTGNLYVCIAVIGYGSDHDRALEAYQRISQGNQQVRVVSFDSQTSGQVIANAVLAQMGITRTA